MEDINKPIEQQLNEYLMLEFGMDEEEGQPTSSWPFKLQPIGRIQQGSGPPDVFLFHDDQPYFALAVDSLDFMPQNNMTFEELKLQFQGSSWIAKNNPIDLDTTRIGYENIPNNIDRRNAVESLGKKIVPNPIILEGIFLIKLGIYIALVENPENQKGYFIGTNLVPNKIGWQNASPWRRLSIAVAITLNKGNLK